MGSPQPCPCCSRAPVEQKGNSATFLTNKDVLTLLSSKRSQPGQRSKPLKSFMCSPFLFTPVWARVGQGLEQELESLATCCDSTRLQFPAWPHTPSREIILDLMELLQTSNLCLAEVRERLTGRDAHGRQLELDRVRNKM